LSFVTWKMEYSRSSQEKKKKIRGNCSSQNKKCICIVIVVD
jgi:hypothetical protein